MIHVVTVPTLTDNYSYLVWHEDSSRAIVIDASEASPISHALREAGLGCGLILATHHHHDHVGGNLALRDEFGCEIWCSAHDLSRVPGATRGLLDKETFSIDGIGFDIWNIPGHTQGQIALYVPGARALFVGDTMFSMGCGRLFEGTPEQMFASLTRIMSAPDETELYVGHEYTLRNGAFAQSVEPGNSEIAKRLERAHSFGRVVPPPTIADEKRVNPFLRTSSQEIRSHLGFTKTDSDIAVFTRLRKMRDTF